MSDTPKPDGGPAFPVPLAKGWEGMTLRDYFAAFALLGEMVRESTGKTNECGPYSGRAWNAYAQADAMLEERDKP